MKVRAGDAKRKLLYISSVLHATMDDAGVGMFAAREIFMITSSAFKKIDCATPFSADLECQVWPTFVLPGRNNMVMLVYPQVCFKILFYM